MRYFIMIMMAFLNMAGAFCQSAQISGCDTAYSSRLREVAMQLTLHRFIQTNNALKDSIQIPDSSYAPILKELCAIYESRDSVHSVDTILNVANAATDSLVPSRVLELRWTSAYVDTSFSWAANLVKGIIPTGNDTIDSIIRQYRMTISSGIVQNSTFSVSFFTAEPINSYALINRMNGSVNGLGPVHSIRYFQWDPSTIDRIDSGLYSVYSFKLSMGDCNPGCSDHRYWIFNVYHDCTVLLDSTFGGPVDFYTSIQSVSGDAVTLSPNPAHDKLNFNYSLQDLDLSISDMTGRVYSLPYSPREIDVSSLASGVYCIRLQDRSGSVVRRFVKE